MEYFDKNVKVQACARSDLLLNPSEPCVAPKNTKFLHCIELSSDPVHKSVCYVDADLLRHSGLFFASTTTEKKEENVFSPGVMHTKCNDSVI